MQETFHLHNFYAFKYFLCDALNFFNVVGQIYFIDKFLGNVFLTYGTKVLYWSEVEPEERSDPMIEVFPRVTKCHFHKYGPSGTIERHDAMCVLALNVVNEKIYVMLWFWLIVLAVVTGNQDKSVDVIEWYDECALVRFILSMNVLLNYAY